MLTTDEKYQKCQSMSKSLIECLLREISQELKILIIIEGNSGISVVESAHTEDFSEAFGLLKLTEIRLSEKEKNRFLARSDVQEMIDKKLNNIVETNKERLN